MNWEEIKKQISEVTSKLFEQYGEEMNSMMMYIGRLLLVYIICKIITKGLGRFFKKRIHAADDTVEDKRKETLMKTTLNMLNYATFFVLLMFAVTPFIDVKQILVATGVLGIVISFGAQSLIKDVLTGVFLLFENQYKNGDMVEINGSGDVGFVEELGLRVTKIRLISGKLMILPNGEIKKVVNGNILKRRVYESVVLSSRENPTKIIQLIEEVAEELNVEFESSLIKREIVSEVVREEGMTDKEYEKVKWMNQYEEPFRFLSISSLDTTMYGIKYNIAATVEDVEHFKVSVAAKNKLAKKLYDNNIRTAEQLMIYKTVSSKN